MENNYIFETKRLRLRTFNLSDAPFIVELLNTPSWKKFIGDKHVHTIEDAEKYLANGPLDSYKKNGFGLSLVYLKDKGTPIGMCGLVKRETLKHVDIGFALMPAYNNLGYGYEIARETLNYAKDVLKIEKVVAITNSNNISSIKLIDKLGLQFEKTIKLSKLDTVLLFAPPKKLCNDKTQIKELTDRFFDLFNNKNGSRVNLNSNNKIFAKNSIFTNGKAQIESLETFLASREKILNDGTLVNFSEQELFGKTTIFANVAQRYVLYEKNGTLNGKDFQANGVKNIQFIKEQEVWKILSVAWCDQ